MPTKLAPVLDPQGGLYLSGEDNLRIRSFGSLASVVLAIEGRVMLCDGTVVPIAESHIPSSTRTVVTSFAGLPEGFLIGLQVRASTGAPRRGQVFVIVELVRGNSAAAQAVGVLAQGYVQDTTDLGWPGTPIVSSADGPGVIRSVTGTNPGAGVEITETVPTNARWKLLSLGARFVASAAAANRIPRLIVDDGATTVFQSDAAAAQTATQNILYTAYQGSQRSILVSDTATWSFPIGLMLMGGHRIRTSTAALDVGDDWAAPQMLVEEWIED